MIFDLLTQNDLVRAYGRESWLDVVLEVIVYG